MRKQILNLIGEQTSPLFRIMSVYNYDEPTRRKFDNNITAFHIGNGIVLSVAHNLRPEAQLIKSLTEEHFQDVIIAHCNDSEAELMHRSFLHDPGTNKRYLNITDQHDVQPTIKALKRMNYDTRWITQYDRGICKPYLVVQFEQNSFYNNEEVTHLFPAHSRFHEPNIGAYTFLIELELIKGFYAEDIAVYRMKNVDKRIIDLLPSATVSYDTHLTNESLFCLQSSPSGTNLGRMINEARIEGVLDHHAVQADRIGGNYLRKGLRYLLKGYFRFGSSGAPYFFYDAEKNSFIINAIQSEASPIQLTIKNDRKGNFQYINAIASPISLIEESLETIKQNEGTNA